MCSPLSLPSLTMLAANGAAAPAAQTANSLSSSTPEQKVDGGRAFIDVCSICHKKYGCEVLASAGSCGHVYHAGCLASWTGSKSGGGNRRSTCPLCKATISMIQCQRITQAARMSFVSELTADVVVAPDPFKVDEKQMSFRWKMDTGTIKNAPKKWVCKRSSVFELCVTD